MMRLLLKSLLGFRQSKSTQGTSGFTLIELMVVIALIGILSTIAAPSWLGFVRQQRVNGINEDVSLALRETQQKARSTKIPQSMSVRVNDEGVAQIAIHRKDVDVATLTDQTWENLGSEKGISADQVLLFTNLLPNQESAAGKKDGNKNKYDKDVAKDTYPQPTSKDKEGPVTIIFDQDGILDPLKIPELGDEKGLLIGVGVPSSNPKLPVKNTQRCVVVRTLLGAMELESGDSCDPWEES